MTIRARYTWGKTTNGYGWQPWEEPGLSLEKDGTTGYWDVYEASGSLLCTCVNYRSAQRVVARLRRLTYAQVTPDAIPDFALIGEGKHGWVVQRIYTHEDPTETYRTREEAEARMGH
jgi:hypothetical protein